MKAITLAFGLFFSQLAFGQQIYSAEDVGQHAIYPKNCTTEKNTKDCFTKSIASDLGNIMTDVAEQFTKGSYATKINFVINEDGSISDIKPATEDLFGEKSAQSFKLLLAKNEISNKKIQAAKINGKNVKMSYSLPVKLVIM